MLTDRRGRLLSLQCPVCGDLAKDEQKLVGHVLEKSSHLDLYGLRKEPPMASHNLEDSFPPGTKVTPLPTNGITVGELRDRLYHNNVREYCPVMVETDTGKILPVVSMRLELAANPDETPFVLEVME